MKIAFIGTHGVGKTTLCFELAARLKRLDYGVDLVKEVARECPLPINLDTTVEAQSWILHTQIARELEAASRSEVVVCDRSVLDNYAYLVNRTGRREFLEPLIRDWLTGYKLLVKVPIWQPLRADGVRATAAAFQTDIDRVIDQLIQLWKIPALSLEGDDPQQWPSQVIAGLDLPPRPEQESLFEE